MLLTITSYEHMWDGAGQQVGGGTYQQVVFSHPNSFEVVLVSPSILILKKKKKNAIQVKNLLVNIA